MVEQRKANSFLDKALVISGMVTLATTWFASRGNNHSKIHKDLARVAMEAEIVTSLAGLALTARVGNRRTLTRLGEIGLGTTILCHGLVAVTDEYFVNHVRAGDLLTTKGVWCLTKEWLGKFREYQQELIGR